MRQNGRIPRREDKRVPRGRGGELVLATLSREWTRKAGPFFSSFIPKRAAHCASSTPIGSRFTRTFNRRAGNVRGIFYARTDLCLIQWRRAWLAYAGEPPLADAPRSSVDWSRSGRGREREREQKRERKREAGANIEKHTKKSSV